jgi:hypothetical protein
VELVELGVQEVRAPSYEPTRRSVSARAEGARAHRDVRSRSIHARCGRPLQTAENALLVRTVATTCVGAPLGFDEARHLDRDRPAGTLNQETAY